ncbi:hypothetical protein CWO85_01170 [Candidatus Phytoplasma ziziphi]|uniref:Uncharacterized protein n=1 Tax=Ziziphus jujuba witches'-broom phytoplasma TaxID=135727 RepID=A0A660HM89_ZIZJU|nr:hypothetical protein [Candidatus Phytoplasma ziziphi]AYJ01144.1 hypothetical protein CWO85_01170 [Candidatus Phytoplasma ziziphi]
MTNDEKIKFILENKKIVDAKTIHIILRKNNKRDINRVFKKICYVKANWGIKFGNGYVVSLATKTTTQEKEQQKTNLKISTDNMKMKTLHNIFYTKKITFLTTTLPAFITKDGKRILNQETTDINKIIKARKHFMFLLNKELIKNGYSKKFIKKVLKSIKVLEITKNQAWHNHIVFLNIDLFQALGHKTTHIKYKKYNSII